MRFAIFFCALAAAGCGQASGGAAAGSTSSGGGAGVCGGVPCTGAHMACDPADDKCKLDGSTTHVGGGCDTSGADAKCGTEDKATCNDATQDGFPGGYCSLEPCTTAALCPIGSTCAHLDGESPACFKNCDSDADCRAPDYVCKDVGRLFTSGSSHKVCFFPSFTCAIDADCPDPAQKCVGATMKTLGACK